jgi:hypothetical protein
MLKKLKSYHIPSKGTEQDFLIDFWKGRDPRGITYVCTVVFATAADAKSRN